MCIGKQSVYLIYFQLINHPKDIIIIIQISRWHIKVEAFSSLGFHICKESNVIVNSYQLTQILFLR